MNKVLTSLSFFAGCVGCGLIAGQGLVGQALIAFAIISCLWTLVYDAR